MIEKTEKDEFVNKQKRIKQVNQSKKRTGKSKEYLNKLKHVGCPIGRTKGKCGCSLEYSKSSLNVKDKGSQNKKLNLIKDQYNIKDFQNEIKEEIAIKKVFEDIDVVLLE